METVRVRKQKLRGDSTIWGAHVVAEDEFGSWLFVPKGSTFAATFADGRQLSVEVGQGSNPEGSDVMFLVPSDGWWLAQWWTDGQFPWVFTVDICSPPTFADGVWTYVDLEVDVYLLQTGIHGIEDFDEFIDAHADGLISDHEYAQAIAATAHVERSLRAQAEPFASVGRAHFDRGRALGLVPLELPGA